MFQSFKRSLDVVYISDINLNNLLVCLDALPSFFRRHLNFLLFDLISNVVPQHRSCTIDILFSSCVHLHNREKNSPFITLFFAFPAN